MSEQDKIQLFENQPIRTAWDEEKEEWYFSVVDVVGALTDQTTSRGASTYWAVVKKRLKDEGADQLLTNCKQLKMTAADGKKRKTDVATIEQLLRIIQSIPSRKAEPMKAWLAQVGRERIEETIDPEQAIDRALETYLKKGYDPDWVHQRLLSIRIRNELTEEWQKRGVEKGKEYAILTDEIMVTSTQGMQDLFSLEGGSYGKGILDASRIKLVMQMEEQEARLIQNKLNLSEEEVRQITRFRRGEGLLCIGYNHVPVAFHTTPKEYEAITTSPTDLRVKRMEAANE